MHVRVERHGDRVDLVPGHADRERADRERLALHALAHVYAHVPDAPVAGIFPEDEVAHARSCPREKAAIAAPPVVLVRDQALATDAIEQPRLGEHEMNEAGAVEADRALEAEPERLIDLRLGNRNHERLLVDGRGGGVGHDRGNDQCERHRGAPHRNPHKNWSPLPRLHSGACSLGWGS